MSTTLAECSDTTKDTTHGAPVVDAGQEYLLRIISADPAVRRLVLDRGRQLSSLSRLGIVLGPEDGQAMTIARAFERLEGDGNAPLSLGGNGLGGFSSDLGEFLYELADVFPALGDLFCILNMNEKSLAEGSVGSIISWTLRRPNFLAVVLLPNQDGASACEPSQNGNLVMVVASGERYVLVGAVGEGMDGAPLAYIRAPPKGLDVGGSSKAQATKPALLGSSKWTVLHATHRGKSPVLVGANGAGVSLSGAHVLIYRRVPLHHITKV